MNAIWLFEKDLTAFLRLWKNPEYADFIPFNKVYKKLKISRSTLIRFANSELLVPAEGYPNLPRSEWLYDPHDIEKYRKTIIKSDVAALIVGCRQVTIGKWTKKGWIKAVSGPSIDGARIFRYDRTALTQWRHERLNSTEVHSYLGIKRHTLDRWAAKGYLQPIRNTPTQMYWYYRKDIERIKESILSAPKKQLPRNFYHVMMSNRVFRLTDSQAQELLEAYNNCKCYLTRTRLLAVYMYGLGHSRGEVMDITEHSDGTINTWCRQYRNEGIEGLRDKRRRVTAKVN